MNTGPVMEYIQSMKRVRNMTSYMMNMKAMGLYELSLATIMMLVNLIGI